MFSSFENIPHRKIIFKKKKKISLTKTHHSTTGTGSWEEKGRAFFGRRQIRRREKERKKERKKEEEREALSGLFFFATREVKKGARLNE